MILYANCWEFFLTVKKDKVIGNKGREKPYRYEHVLVSSLVDMTTQPEIHIVSLA